MGDAEGALDVSGNTVITGTLDVTGNVVIDGNLDADQICATSDERYKNSIETLNDNEMIETASNIRTVKFFFNNETPPKKHIGFVAQELLEIMPHLVNTSDPDKYSVNYIETCAIIPMLCRKVIEMQAKIEELEKKC